MPDDFSPLKKMIYSGRGITVGLTPSGNPFIGYSLTGRSPSSQARKLILDGKGIRTMPLDEEQLKKGNPLLLLYPAIVSVRDNSMLIASNGAQTNALVKMAEENKALGPIDLFNGAFSSPKIAEGIDLSSYEPDVPNYTPRISAIAQGDKAAMFIVRNKNGEQDSDIYPITFEKGKGKMITTYLGANEKPALVSFLGEPFTIAVRSEKSEEIVESLYAAIKGGWTSDENYRVAAAVMMIKPGGLETAIINRSERGN